MKTLYLLNETHYRLKSKDGHLFFQKAAKGKQAPGQMSLFDESAHPREEHGKFTSKGNEASKGNESKGAPPSPFKGVSQHLKDVYFQKMSPEDAKSIGLDPSHPAAGWDEEFHAEASKIYAKDGATGLADHLLADSHEMESDHPIVKMLLSKAFANTDWEAVWQHASNYLDTHKAEPFQGSQASSLIAKYLTDVIDGSDEEDVQHLRKMLMSPDGLKKQIRRDLNDSADKLQQDLLTAAKSGLDKQQLGEEVAQAMRLPHSQAHGGPMRVQRWEDSEDGRKQAKPSPAP